MYHEREEILTGIVCGITYQNAENGYSVLKLRCDTGETETIVGIIPMASIGEKLMVTGKWNSHPSYGKQFEAEFLERMMPETENEILAFLSSRTIRGIGAVTAERIVSRFGKDSLNVLEHTPERLSEIQGISPKKAQELGELFRQQVSIRRLLEFLSSHGLPVELAMQLYRAFGSDAEQAVRENPYLLAAPEFGADFSAVDRFAMELGMDGEDTRRVEAGILFELSYNLNNGHTFLPKNKLIPATAQLLELSSDQVAASMEELLQYGRVEEDTIANLTACYLPELYESEIYVTLRMIRMASLKDAVPHNLHAMVLQAEARLDMDFSPTQEEAIRMALENRVLLLTGGPGTGKTTTLSGILRVFDMLRYKTVLAAPTGRAAKRLSELTGHDAATIHRLLETRYSEDTGRLEFAHDEDDPLDAEAVIVDETSMVDIQLMASLLRAIPEECKLILVGDPDQLPSVGPGNLLSDLLRSGRIETIRLTEIFRQAQKSLIIMNAHAVNHGELPELTRKDKDFFFIRKLDPAEAVETIRDLCARRLPENMHIPPEDIQVLTPTRKFETGTNNLNRVLQSALNPPEIGKKEKMSHDFPFREGDRIMQIRNNYDIMWKRVDGFGAGVGIFNGDIGRVISINYPEEQVLLRFDDREAVYSFDMLNELEPAYAMTVHKSQGSEYRAVILAALQGSSLLLTRSILYTAITRAKELLIIVGDERVISFMTENNKQSRRYSGLKLRLEKA